MFRCDTILLRYCKSRGRVYTAKDGWRVEGTTVHNIKYNIIVMVGEDGERGPRRRREGRITWSTVVEDKIINSISQ